MKISLAMLVVCAALLLAPLPSPAQDAALEVNGDAIKQNLERQMGKRVRIRLVSGGEFEGTVVAVGTAAVHMGRLAGLDFFDSVVRLDQIAAVVVRVRGN